MPLQIKLFDFAFLQTNNLRGRVYFIVCVREARAGTQERAEAGIGEKHCLLACCQAHILLFSPQPCLICLGVVLPTVI